MLHWPSLWLLHLHLQLLLLLLMLLQQLLGLLLPLVVMLGQQLLELCGCCCVGHCCEDTFDVCAAL